jgi:DNA-binding protein YbaB
MNDNTMNNINADEGLAMDMEGLFAKAQIVHARINELRERIDRSVFTGESEGGLFRIGLYGDGHPASVEMRMDMDEACRKLIEDEIFEALEEVFHLRMQALDDGLRAVQEETGVDSDMAMPF